LGRLRHLSALQGARMIEQMRALPGQVEKALGCDPDARRVAEKYARCTSFLFLGRQYLYPAALEGALKLKEISYAHAEGYPAAEMKHGPIALVDRETPSVFLAIRGPAFDKVRRNLDELKPRGAPVLAIASEGDAE